MYIRRKDKHHVNGFTLVELIVVIVIILILSAILIPSILKYVRNSREASALACAKQFQTAYEASVADFIADGTYLNDNDVNTDYAYEAVSNKYPAPAGGRSKAVYDAMNAGAVSAKFEALGLFNIRTCQVELIRYKDHDLDIVFEYTPTQGWHKMNSYISGGPWTSEFSSLTGTSDIWWNGRG